MKKTILTLMLAAVTAVSSFAQASIGAGYLESYRKSGSTSSSQSGFYFGVDTNIGNCGDLEVKPGVYIEYVTSSEAADFFGFAGASGKSTEMYLDIPVNFNYGVDLGGAKLSFYAGPTFSLGCLSTIESSASVLGVSTGTRTVNQYANNSEYSRFDLMVGGGVSLDISEIRLSAGYNYGLVDRYGSSSFDLHRSNLHFGVAYLF